MNNVKNEIKRAIGETTSHKEKVWQNLQQPKRSQKPRMPLFISIALIVVTSLWILTLQFTPDSEQSANDKGTGELAFTSLPFEMQWPPYLRESPTILFATNEEELAQYTSNLKVNLKASVDFTKHDVLITLYASDGCGLVVDQLTSSENMVYVHLALPPELRDVKELACTTIQEWHLDILQIDKQTIEQAIFMEGFTPINTSFNSLNVEQIDYDFELLSNPDVIESIIIKENINNNAINITTQALTSEFSQLTLALVPVPGIANTTNPQYELSILTHDGSSQKIYLWLSEESDMISVMSSRNMHQLYTLSKEKAVVLLHSIEGDWDDVQ